MNELSGASVEKWEITVTKKVVSERLLKWPTLRREGFDDLVQECLIYWLKKRSDCNLADKGKPEVYMARVLKNHLSHILCHIRSEKNKPVYQSESIDEFLEDDDSAKPLGSAFRSRIAENPALKTDIEPVLKELTPEQKKICALLLDETSPLQVSKRLKKHHSYVYREIERIRQLFESKGLKEHLSGN